MNKDQENSNDNSKQNDLQADFTVDLDLNESKDLKAGQSTIQGSTAQGSTSQSEGVTSINISSIGQTMDITPSDQSSGSGTLDLEQINGQTVDLDQQPAQDPDSHDGTRMISPSMAPFGGKVFEPNASPQPPDGDGGTRLVGQDQNPYGQTMDIHVQEESGPAQPPDRTMLLSDSQQGSQAGSSSLAGKSSYDQTMDLADSASESKSGSDARVSGSGIKTGQSINASGRSNMKSMGDSKQYLQAERANASDSIFDRIQARSISYTIDWNDKTKDYQINQKIDSKTGKLDLHVLGKGGMGLVYLATQNSVNRPVALKIIRKDKQNDTFSKQFFYEAEITALLEHPNITPIYELGKTPDHTYFYTMKYIQGTPWEKKIRTNSIEENLDIFDKLCDAIAFAHSKNILHMDIKPDNVQLGEFGEVYAVDWGVASDLKRPESVRCAGTWQWISPEVARGEKSRIGKGSDIYLLGGILFQIVTGHHPRLPKDPSEKLSDPALRKAAINNIIQATDCKDPMVAVALKALATEPQDRYAKVEHLQEAIHAIQKERAAIKSSQELTKRAIVLASEATEQGDYGRFNQSLFGLKDAIELWDKNPDAPSELKKVRLAYGQCAFEKGDYDLALQTLDRKETQEDELYRKAEQAQTAVKLRAERFRLLRNVFIASLILGTGVVTYFWYNAVLAKEGEVNARMKAQENEQEAIRQGNIAKQNADEAKRQAGIAKKNEDEANRQAGIAKTNEEEARKQKTAAERELAKTQLTELVSQLGLARSSISESNPSGAFSLLTGINDKQTEYIKEKLNKDALAKDSKDTQENALITKIPDLENWSKNRIAFLDNADNGSNPQIELFDLIKEKDKIGFDIEKSAIAINAAKSNLIVANPNGDIYQIAFDGSSPQRIPNEVTKIPVMPAKRIRPGREGNRLFLSFDRVSDPIVLVDLEKHTQLEFQIELPKSNDLVSVSPSGNSIATSKGGTVWFVRNKAGANGYSFTTHEKAEQLHWLNDELILVLIENNGRYFLSLVAPFAKFDQENRPVPIDMRVALKADVVRFAILDENLPIAVQKLNREETVANELSKKSKNEVREEFSKILESIQFLFGFSDGNLAQARLYKPSKTITLENGMDIGADSEIWDLKDKFMLTRKHYHKVEEIQVQYESIEGQMNRRILTRGSNEQAVQIWNLNDDSDRDNENDTAVTESVSHLLSLAGLPLQEQSDNQGIKLAEFTKEGKVLLVNSEWKAQLLDVDEQLSRQRFSLETPFRSSTYEETASKWLFDTSDQRAISIDGYGAVTKYDLVKGLRIPLGQNHGHWRITQNTNPFKQGEVEKIILHDTQGDVNYWGHSPFAKVKHFALSPDGKTAVSIAMIPAEKSVYFVPRNTDKLAESLRF
ncbi:MAG: protein kinase domain-containing protein, partial [Planctomycetota bacterium]